jgi:hypothetical protein
MRRLALSAAVLFAVAPVAAFGQGSSASKSKADPQSKSQSKEMPGDPMAGWTPPKITREAQGKKELHAMFKKMEDAGRKGDLEAAAALIDFPVMMITDSKSGEAMGDPWSREQWEQVMKPFYEKPMADMKVTHSPTIFFLSDNLASVDDKWTMTTAGKKMTGRSSSIAIRKGGEWKVKAMVEGGWGDMPMPEGTTTGTSGSGMSGSTGSTGSTDTGSTGTMGGTESGTTGGTGTTGDTGTTGSGTGTTGSTGSTGTTGDTGTSGSTGTGTSGSTGTGTSGSTGTGTTGGSGTEGTTGSTPQPGGTK